MENKILLIRSQIQVRDMLFRRALSQVNLLNNRLWDMKVPLAWFSKSYSNLIPHVNFIFLTLQVRYDRAGRDQQKALRHYCRVQIGVYEGIRNLYYLYACLKCDEIQELEELYCDLMGFDYEVKQIIFKLSLRTEKM